MESINLYDEVQWESSAGGKTKVKTGIVMGVVKANEDPTQQIKKLMDDGIYKSAFGYGLPRTKKSFIVAVAGPTQKTKMTLYWPHTNKLYPFMPVQKA